MWVTKCRRGQEVKVSGPALIKVIAVGEDGEMPPDVIKLGIEAPQSTIITLVEDEQEDQE